MSDFIIAACYQEIPTFYLTLSKPRSRIFHTTRKIATNGKSVFLKKSRQ